MLIALAGDSPYPGAPNTSTADSLRGRGLINRLTLGTLGVGPSSRAGVRPPQL